MQARERHHTGSSTLRTQSVLLTNGTTAPWLLHDHFTLQRATHKSHAITPHCLPRDPPQDQAHIEGTRGLPRGNRAMEYLSTAEFWAVSSTNALPMEAAAALTGLLPFRSRLPKEKRSVGRSQIFFSF